MLRVFPNSGNGKRAMSKVENLKVDRSSIKARLRRFHELELELVMGYEKQESFSGSAACFSWGPECWKGVSGWGRVDF